MVGQRVDRLWVQPHGTSTRGHVAGGGHRVAAGEQGDLVPLPHQCFGEVGDNPFGAAVALGGHRLTQWGNLRNTHHAPSSHKSGTMRLPGEGAFVLAAPSARDGPSLQANGGYEFVTCVAQDILARQRNPRNAKIARTTTTRPMR